MRNEHFSVHDLCAYQDGSAIIDEFTQTMEPVTRCLEFGNLELALCSYALDTLPLMRRIQENIPSPIPQGSRRANIWTAKCSKPLLHHFSIICSNIFGRINNPPTMKNVCAACFDDKDLRSWIRAHNGPRGCWACAQRDAPTAPLDNIQTRILECAQRYYGRAVDQMYYNSREGGYIGEHWDSYDLMQMLDIALPRDDGSLFDAIVDALGQEPWCHYDVGTLDLDNALRSSWKSFCQTIKHKRRFFFHSTGEDSRDTWTPLSLLRHIADHCEQIGLIRDIPPRTRLWRARPDLQKGKRARAADFGPPPSEYALQSNRMNPPGISMLYAASSIKTALHETRTTSARLGLWRVAESLRVLDLRALPPVPGMFSDTSRTARHALRFLHSFSNDIMQPVERSQRVNVDYLPSQVVTEFIRDYPFQDGAIDGIAYPSSVTKAGWNVALFLEPANLGLEPPEYWEAATISLSFERDQWVEIGS
ncbi:HEPN-associated N-terminal domain-containing protein [Achromobacter aegrifaciens]|uniref:Uncharacterized conserved protein n=1 Tax=Achromobacter aegrifaciens TaxID=1287736 RepID=A0AAD2J1X6_ACHAE|nr:HEPN-associated N-terminal domain-containing protein [Achromobacter aegrifaciens]CUJ42726.1 Uncharacterized conserved protein [Achromobacter aegrifaciens]